MLEGQTEFSIIKLSELDAIKFRIDAEFYQRRYLRLQERLARLGSISLKVAGAKLDCSAFYPSITDQYNFEGEGIPFLRVNEIQNGLVKTTDSTAFLPQYVLDNNPTTISIAYPFDIVIAKGGNSLAKLGLLPTDFQQYALSRDLIVMRTSFLKRNKYFVWLFFHSDFGQDLLWRTASQTGQPHLSLSSIEQLDIPIYSEKFESSAETLYKQSVKLKNESMIAYRRAETLLLATLGIVDFSPSTEAVNIKSFKDSFAATGRLDAEYYQPKFHELEAKIAETHKLISLGSVLLLNQRGTQPDYADSGLPVINSKHVREGEVVLFDNRVANLPDNEKSLFIQKGDVLINGTGVGTIGRAAPYLHNQNAIPDNHVTILRTDKLNPIFLSVYLNSIAGKYQVDKYFKGSSGQIELYPKDIDCFYMPLVDETIQTEIADLVQQSFTLKAESERLLEVAKRAVEIAIEQDEAAGMAYMEALT